MIKTILFDIGGVITNTEFGNVYSSFGLRMGLNEEAVEKYHKENFDQMLTGEITLEKFWRDMRDLGGYEGLDYEGIWLEEVTKNRKVDTLLLDFIKELKIKCSVGVLSNLTFTRYIADQKIGLYDNFDFTVLSCFEHLRKPDPNFYQLAIERSGVLPTEIVLIDDREVNLKVAQDIGMQVIQYHFVEGVQSLKDKINSMLY